MGDIVFINVSSHQVCVGSFEWRSRDSGVKESEVCSKDKLVSIRNMASPKNFIETDEIVGVESEQEEKSLTKLALGAFGQISKALEGEQITTPRKEIDPSDWSHETDIVEVEMEDVEIQLVEERTADQGLVTTEEELWKMVRSNSHAVLARAAETRILEIDIPLYQMVAMIEIRQPLEVDIQKLRAKFTWVYMHGGLVFYVAIRSFGMEESFISDEMRKGCSRLYEGTLNYRF